MIVAAGRGSRFGASKPKQYVHICGQTLLQLSVARLATSTYIDHCLLVIAADDTRAQTLAFAMPVSFTQGGAERWQSVHLGVDAIIEQGAGDDDLILIHDAARPSVPTRDIERVIVAAMSEPYGAILAVPAADTLKQSQKIDNPLLSNHLLNNHFLTSTNRSISDHSKNDSYYTQATIDRSCIWQAQTPQVFRLGQLREVLSQVAKHNFNITDEASAFEQLNLPIRLISGSRQNIKLTFPDDALLITAIINMQVNY
ncbi:2-C-methyl-D-erythritol 4-phosphate cytidylyltransferase [Psychrobacter sp. M13]|uniref:IspD/TarI family cytidylyltransferase n=1 Tax=Psychrobacter sp. M13 TaxID=3067275 RepID=UPI00273C75F7|nr:2-C-methyl-D-erythritol 4-phosphate cytidylyltransferase [Psychrobacter sp. M13]WLP93841.1 2-C-methyl-D-erythritol 4-phosphate cytidylyltransferase [Psychrobacter sp. M13]